TSFVYGNAGIAIPRTATEQFSAAHPTSQHRLQPGDLVFFNTEGRKISHVGIYVGAGQFVHAPGAGKRVSRDSLNDTYWRRRIRGSGHYFRM
ncbi:MAG: C40 family peptidase, partial [Gammaproteobacteria bacterium]|nr:C40 family peptidase [Gammaproteobacteria bacterium]